MLLNQTSQLLRSSSDLFFGFSNDKSIGWSVLALAFLLFPQKYPSCVFGFIPLTLFCWLRLGFSRTKTWVSFQSFVPNTLFIVCVLWKWAWAKQQISWRMCVCLYCFKCHSSVVSVLFCCVFEKGGEHHCSICLFFSSKKNPFFKDRQRRKGYYP